MNSIKSFNTTNECTSNALYVCEIEHFFRWISLYDNTAWVGYVTIPDDAQIITIEDKIKTNKVILHEPLIPLVDFIDIAITNNADVHTCDDNALRWASDNGKLDIVKSLIKYGADVNTYHCQAFRMACYSGHLDIVECLIANGVDIDEYKDEALSRAHVNGHYNIVNLLIKHGATM